jgi:UDP-3-O-[3-hydroxymyristoyl] glucosamine N-acyltransferase
VSEAGRPLRLAELAASVGRQFGGDGDTPITGVAALDAAGPGDLAFVRSTQYAPQAAATRAGALILPEGVDPGVRPFIRSPDPALDFARLAPRIVGVAPPVAGIAAGACVAAGVQIDESASIAASAVVGARTVLGPRTQILAGAVLYPDVRIGADCVIHGGVIVRENSRIGDRVVLQPGVVIGSDGFGFVIDEQGARVRMPHLGHVVIEDDVEIGANSTVDRGTLGETRIRRGAKIDNLVQIAHNCDIGEDVVIIAQSGLAGSTRVGARAILMARAGTTGHLEIGAGAFVGARAGLHKDVAPGARVYGSPQQEERVWHRVTAALTHLPDMLRRLRAVERSVGLRPARKRSDEEDGA